jgi:predicted DCC family thiol-disulfide oxidoreductase YuxK
MSISVSTEITDARFQMSIPSTPLPRRGWILYDGGCVFCLSIVRLIRGVFERRGFEFLPLQTPWVRAEFNLPELELLAEMRLLMRNGEKFGGPDAIPVLAGFVWWAWPVTVLAQVPGVLCLLSAAYRYVATRRHCITGTCSIPSKSPRQIANTQRRI